MKLEDYIRKECADENNNCSMAMLKACNEYYNLNLGAEAGNLMEGFGGGMFEGIVCGALVACTACLSDLVSRTDTDGESDKVCQAQELLMKNFREMEGCSSWDCKDIRPKHWSEENRFLKTLLIAGQALEKTLDQLDIHPAVQG